MKFVFRGLVVVTVLLWQASAQAITVLNTDGSWNQISDTRYSVTVSEQSILKFTEGGTPGNRFLFTILLGISGTTFAQVATSEVPVAASPDVGSDFAAAFANSAFSSATFAIGPGVYEIQVGSLSITPPGVGAIALAPIPEPRTWTTLALGLGALGWVARPRRALRQSTLRL